MGNRNRPIGTSPSLFSGSLSNADFSQVGGGGHKEYIKKMLIAKFNKKYNETNSF
jgi:hypothetical protein